MQTAHPVGTLSDPETVVDLRSDTVTRPTEAMYERMRHAPLGDDGLDGDPTAIELETRVAGLLGKEAGLFVPSCTMANLLAILAQTRRAEQILLEEGAHIYTTERGAATFTGLFYKPISSSDGAMDLDSLEEILLLDRGRIDTSLICLETSHNGAGGIALPVSHMRAVQDVARKNGLSVHLDGARLFNAAVALNEEPAEIASCADTVSICLSKGLSAPAGAVLVGPEDTIAHARHTRKMLGGTQRQVGVFAAAGLEAIEVMRLRLAEDHGRARRLSDAINSEQSGLRANVPQTNIVQIDVTKTGRHSAEWVNDLAAVGVLTRPLDRARIRCVTHRHIDDAAIDVAARAFLSLASDRTRKAGDSS